ncbi:MAG: hypothetical protein ACTHMS_05015 [Jatrophihabitans sp.]|uniref:hypothetical protein n=1 Tax=Jatrophihabitans sp. TaxID=1932789 RepID=UPI003F7EE6B2
MRWRPLLGVPVLGAALAMAGCTSSSAPPPPTTSTITTTVAPHVTPVSTGPTTAATARRCPLIDEQTAADDLGMRLDRITVLRSGGAVVGCRIYALQGSPLSQSEKLPPGRQPALEVTITRYGSAKAAYNATVLVARRGTNPQQVRLQGTTGVCFQTAFYRADHGRDWACAVPHGVTMVLVRTVVTSPSFNAVQATKHLRLP